MSTVKKVSNEYSFRFINIFSSTLSMPSLCLLTVHVLAVAFAGKEACGNSRFEASIREFIWETEF